MSTLISFSTSAGAVF